MSNGYGQGTTGCAVDGALDLYTTDFVDNRVVKLSHAAPHPVLLDLLTDGIAGTPDRRNESVVVDATAHFFVGHAGDPSGSTAIHRYDPAGVLAGRYSGGH